MAGDDAASDHAAALGGKLFVGYAGDKIAVVIDRLTGEVREAHIFVGIQPVLRGGDLERDAAGRPTSSP